MRRKSGLRRWRWLALGVLTLLGASVLTAWLMFQHIPSWYQPMDIPPADQRNRIRIEATAAYENFNQKLATATAPFDWQITQDRLNEWLGAREVIWPLSRDWFGPDISGPMVVIEPDGVRIAATCRLGGVQTVVSALFEAVADEEAVTIRLAEIESGSLPLPPTWAREQLAKLDTGGWPAGRRSPWQYDSTPLPRLSTLPDGADFPNGWIWRNGDYRRPFRVTDIRLEPGALTLRIEPLTPQSRR